jgi:hypothetical protein
MKKTLTLFAIAAMAVMGSCKKDKTEPVEETNEPVESVSGSLTVITQQDIGANPMPFMMFGTAIFYLQPNGIDYIEVDSVILNGIGLEFTSFNYITPPDSLKDVSKAKWEVRGNNWIPSFKAENNRGMPVYTGYSSIPDVISPAKDYTLTLTGLSNTDFYIVSIRDLNGGDLTRKEVDMTNKTVTFTAAELATMDTDAVIQVAVVNHVIETVEGKMFSIQNEAAYYKEIEIK